MMVPGRNWYWLLPSGGFFMTRFDFVLYSCAFFSGSIVSCCICLPASAEGFTVDKDALEKVKPYTAPRKIYILDESPVVKDMRRPPEVQRRYRINVPALPAAGAVTTDINLPGVSSGTGGADYSGNRPGMIVGDGLPQSGFESNMHALKPNRNLPGTKMGVMRSGRVKGRMKGLKGNPDAGRRPANLRIRPTGGGAPEMLKYAGNSGDTAHGSNASRVKTGVRGELKGRGGKANSGSGSIRKHELLDKTGH